MKRLLVCLLLVGVVRCGESAQGAQQPSGNIQQEAARDDSQLKPGRSAIPSKKKMASRPFGPNVLMTEQAKAPTRADQTAVDKKQVDRVIETRNRLVDYLRKRWAGEPEDDSFAAQSLNGLGLNSVDFVEILLIQATERNLSEQDVTRFLKTGGPDNTKEANLFNRVTILDSFDVNARYVLLVSGVVGDRREIAPFREEYDSVRSLDRFCNALEAWSLRRGKRPRPRRTDNRQDRGT
jgi:hypothetical protein